MSRNTPESVAPTCSSLACRVVSTLDGELLRLGKRSQLTTWRDSKMANSIVVNMPKQDLVGPHVESL